MKILLRRNKTFKRVIAERVESAPPTGIGQKFSVLKSLMQIEFNISKIDFNVYANKDELF